MMLLVFVLAVLASVSTASAYDSREEAYMEMITEDFGEGLEYDVQESSSIGTGGRIDGCPVADFDWQELERTDAKGLFAFLGHGGKYVGERFFPEGPLYGLDDLNLEFGKSTIRLIDSAFYDVEYAYDFNGRQYTSQYACYLFSIETEDGDTFEHLFMSSNENDDGIGCVSGKMLQGRSRKAEYESQLAGGRIAGIKDCDEWVSLREYPDKSSERITKVNLHNYVLAGEEFGDFTRCFYECSWGYILTAYLAEDE